MAKKSEMKGWKDEVRDLWGIFLGDADSGCGVTSHGSEEANGGYLA